MNSKETNTVLPATASEQLAALFRKVADVEAQTANQKHLFLAIMQITFSMGAGECRDAIACLCNYGLAETEQVEMVREEVFRALHPFAYPAKAVAA